MPERSKRSIRISDGFIKGLQVSNGINGKVTNGKAGLPEIVHSIFVISEIQSCHHRIIASCTQVNTRDSIGFGFTGGNASRREQCGICTRNNTRYLSRQLHGISSRECHSICTVISHIHLNIGSVIRT